MSVPGKEFAVTDADAIVLYLANQLIMPRLVADEQFAVARFIHQAMPDRVFHEWLYHHRRNTYFLRTYSLFYFDVIGKRMIEADEFHPKIIMQIIQVFPDRDIWPSGIFQRKPYHLRKFVQVIIGVLLFIFKDHLFDTTEAVENKVRVHLGKQRTEYGIAGLTFQLCA